MEKSYRRYVRAAKVKLRFLETLWLIEKLEVETESEDFSAAKDALCFTVLNSTVVSSEVSMVYCWTRILQQLTNEVRSEH